MELLTRQYYQIKSRAVTCRMAAGSAYLLKQKIGLGSHLRGVAQHYRISEVPEPLYRVAFAPVQGRRSGPLFVIRLARGDESEAGRYNRISRDDSRGLGDSARNGTGNNSRMCFAEFF